jgi:hypothetical protein
MKYYIIRLSKDNFFNEYGFIQQHYDELRVLHYRTVRISKATIFKSRTDAQNIIDAKPHYDAFWTNTKVLNENEVVAYLL